jgi:hypothetical protein
MDTVIGRRARETNLHLVDPLPKSHFGLEVSSAMLPRRYVLILFFVTLDNLVLLY